MPIQDPIAVALSGGVDSAVTAALLLSQGRKVLGISMKTKNSGQGLQGDDTSPGCGSGGADDIAACERLCARLGIEYRAVDLSAEYESLVLDYFRRAYLEGRTPNPCVVCNRTLKFGILPKIARECGYPRFATGHYARIEPRPSCRPDARPLSWLRRAVDPLKDQSYFLYDIPAETLASLEFPLGQMHKAEVRAKARELGLEVADKADSQDFVKDGGYSRLFSERPPEAGNFVDGEGRILGRHRGLAFYTIGQRRGLGVAVNSEALYVLRIDKARNEILLGPNEELLVPGLLARDFRLRDEEKTEPFTAWAKIRHNHRAALCVALPQAEGGCRVDFAEAQRAVAPGQSVVLYDEEGFVLGGGVIEAALAP